MDIIRTSRRTAVALLAAGGLAAALPSTQAHAGVDLPEPENFRFLWRAEDLGSGHHIVVEEFGEGPYILDLSEKRWDEEAGYWTRRKDDVSVAEYEADPTNDKHLIWGEPIYSPTDGEIIACWRNAPDNPAPGEKLPEVNEEIPTAGNHVAIKTPGGHVFVVAHFMQGTIPASLCPHDDEYLVDQDDRLDSDCPDPAQEEVSGIAVETYIEEGSRPLVAEGQYLGDGGNSGNSTGPHTHVHVRPLFGTDMCPSVAIPFWGAWRQDYAAATPEDETAWELLSGDAITDAVGDSLIKAAGDDVGPGQAAAVCCDVVGQKPSIELQPPTPPVVRSEPPSSAPLRADLGRSRPGFRDGSTPDRPAG
jgi:hypothetical protein